MKFKNVQGNNFKIGSNRQTIPKKWSLYNSGMAEASNSIINDVEYGNGIFVAVGNENISGVTTARLLTSTDGKNWSIQSHGSGIFYTVKFIDGWFYVLGDNKKFMRSSNGISWNNLTTSLGSTFFMRTIHKGNGMFIAAGGADNSGNSTYSSTGTSWANVSTNNSNTTQQIQGSTNAFGKHFLFGGSGVIRSSSFGSSSWASITNPLGTAHFSRGCIYDGTRVIATTYSNNTVQSTNGINWSSVDVGYTATNLKYINDYYIATGNSGMVRLGKDFQELELVDVGFSSSITVTSSVTNGNTFVVVGNYGKISTSDL